MDTFDLLAKGDLGAVEAALAADPTLADERHASGASLLAWCWYVGKPEAAPIVRKHLGDLDPYDAIIADDITAVRAHLSRDWDGNALSPDGFTPLGLAAFFSRPAIFDVLLPMTRDVNERAQNRQQVAAIHAAVSADSTDMVEKLLRAGASPNLFQADKFTPLHAAAFHGNAAIAGLLLLYGADPAAKNAKGQTAADIARENGHAWLAERLGAFVR
jgi:ankyrin repeat protein